MNRTCFSEKLLVKNLVFILLFNAVALSSTAFSETMVCQREGGNTALIVMDMQPGFITRGGSANLPENKTKVAQIIAEQLDAIESAKKAKIPIIFLEYEGKRGPTNPVLRKATSGYRQVRYFKKDTDGMFDNDNRYKNKLVRYLKSKRISALVMTGANGGGCVLSSIEGALDSNCTVFAYTKGIADFNYRDFIYPYVGYYKYVRANCKDCVFQEISNRSDVASVMVQNSIRVSEPTTVEDSTGVAE